MTALRRTAAAVATCTADAARSIAPVSAHDGDDHAAPDGSPRLSRQQTR